MFGDASGYPSWVLGFQVVLFRSVCSALFGYVVWCGEVEVVDGSVLFGYVDEPVVG